MSSNFQIDYRKSDGDLHLYPRGDFDGSSAWELVNLITDQYDGRGQIFIETGALCDMCPFGCSMFKCQLDLHRFPVKQLCFKGERGRDMAPRGSLVLPEDKVDDCRCSGNCSTCLCTTRVVKE